MRTYNFGKTASVCYDGRFEDHGDFKFIENGHEISLSGTFKDCSLKAIKMFRSKNQSKFVRSYCESDNAFCFKHLTVGENYISMSAIDD